MQDLAIIKIKINDLKAKVENDSISPVYLGTILDDLLTSLSEIDETITDTIDEALKDTKNIVGSIDISDLDNITRMEALAASMGPGPYRYNVTDNNRIVGLLSVISDEMGHVYTQVLVTHRVINDAGQLTTSHSDTDTYIYSRSYGISSTASIPQEQWTSWKKLQSELVHEKGQSETVAMSQKAVTDELESMTAEMATLRANTVMALEIDQTTGDVLLLYDEDNTTISDAYIDPVTGDITIVQEINQNS